MYIRQRVYSGIGSVFRCPSSGVETADMTTTVQDNDRARQRGETHAEVPSGSQLLEQRPGPRQADCSQVGSVVDCNSRSLLPGYRECVRRERETSC